MTTTLPIIFATDRVNEAIYGPVSFFVDYINMLISNGLPNSKIPQSYMDLYLLDFYDTQVRNGGHSQFIHNSHGNIERNLECSRRAALFLNLADINDIIQDCKNWCNIHAEECSRQDGFRNRAAPLDDLDKRMYKLEYDDAAYAIFVAGQSESVRAWIMTATKRTDFYARNKYHLGAGSWLLTQPQTRVLDIEAWQPAIGELFASYGLIENRIE